MGKVWYKIYRVLVIIVAILVGYIIANNYVKQKVLRPLCMVDSNSCIKISYYKYNNSVLVYINNSETWLWYNGIKVYIYGMPTGQLCLNPNQYEAAYAIDPKTGIKEGYSCVMALGEVLKFYEEKKVSPLMYIRRGENTDIYSILTMLQTDGIVDFEN